MLFKRSIAIGALLLATAVSANGEGAIAIGAPPPPSPAFDWSGAYFGAYGGYILGPGAG